MGYVLAFALGVLVGVLWLVAGAFVAFTRDDAE
jgi:hypothetical protein